MADKVKPIGMEELADGNQTVPVPTEMDPSQDYAAVAGVAFQNLDTHLVDISGDDIQFTDVTVGTKSVDQVQSTARVSANDTTPGNLLAKLASGDAIALTELNDAGDEDLELNVAINPETLVTAVASDEVLIADASDSFNIKKALISDFAASVFGTEFEFAESLGISSTTSTTFVEKLGFTTASVPAGDYCIVWSYELGNANNQKTSEALVELDNTTTLGEATTTVNSGGNFVAAGGKAVVTLTAATHTIDIDFRAVSNTAEIMRARIAIWRVS